MKRVLLYASGAIVILGTLLQVQGCGGGDTEVGVKVGSIATAVSARGGARAVYPEDAVQSNKPFAFAKVDGIKLTLRSIQALKSGANEKTLVEFSGGKEVTIAPGSANNVPISENVSIDSGTYDGIKVRYDNSYKVKAYCRTNTMFVYTTAAGIVAQALPAPATLPALYDYYSYPFAAITVATSATGGNPETMEQTDGSYTITKGSAVDMAVLFDPSYLVTCFDGSTSLAASSDKLSPFNWSNNNGVAATAFFPDTSPNFGMGYVPIFIWVSQTAGEALPTAETYAATRTAGDLTGNINFQNVAITSFAFRANGDILAARARISNGGTSGDFQQFFTDYTTTGRVSYSMKNGEWTCDAGYTNCRGIQDRSITGFVRTSDLTTVSSVSSYSDGPDCGKTCTFPGKETEWGNRCRPCTNTTIPMNWKQLPR